MLRVFIGKYVVLLCLKMIQKTDFANIKQLSFSRDNCDDYLCLASDHDP